MRNAPCPHGGGLKGKNFGVQLNTSLFISSLFLVLCFILYLIKAKGVYMFGKFNFPVVACYVTHHKDLLLSLGKKNLYSQLAYVTFGRHYLTETSSYICSNWDLFEKWLSVFSWTACWFALLSLPFTGFIYLIHSFSKLRYIPVYTRFSCKLSNKLL